MKLKNTLSTFLAIVALAGLLSACKTAPKETDAQMKARAKISEAEARQIALTKVPNGTIKTGELENEKGHLIWSFDIAIPDSKNIKEVNIDAISGKVLAVDTETPSAQAKEKAEDEKENIKR